MVEIIEYENENKYKDQIINLWIEVCIDEFGFEEWREDLENMKHHTYSENNGKFLIAIDEGKVVGTISLINQGNKKGMLKAFYVKKDYRANKLGLKLMEEMINNAKKLEYKELILDTYEAFESAIRFYKKYGFETIEKNKDKLVMEYTL